MKYNGPLSRYGVSLRCVQESDAAFMYELRTSPDAAGRVGDPPASIEAQRQWIGSVLGSEDDYCFIVEQQRFGQAGTVSLTVLDEDTAEPGRWIVKTSSLAAAASSLLIYTFAFETLGFARIRMCVESGNSPVLNYHRRYRARLVLIEEKAREIGGTLRDLHWFEIDRSEWPRVKAYFASRAKLAQELMSRVVSDYAADRFAGGIP